MNQLGEWKPQTENLKLMFRDLVKWTLLLSLISAAIIKIVNPPLFLPYFSEIPITSELSIYFSLIFFSGFQILITILALIPRFSNKVYKPIFMTFTVLSVLSLNALFLG